MDGHLGCFLTTLKNGAVNMEVQIPLQDNDFNLFGFRARCGNTRLYVSSVFNFLKIFFVFREGGREGEKRGTKTLMCGCLLSAFYWGPGLQPRHVP